MYCRYNATGDYSCNPNLKPIVENFSNQPQNQQKNVLNPKLNSTLLIKTEIITKAPPPVHNVPQGKNKSNELVSTKIVPVPNCPNGWHFSEPKMCIKNTCDNGWHESSGTCIKNCDNGWRELTPGTCIKNCDEGWYESAPGTCKKKCPDKYDNNNGICFLQSTRGPWYDNSYEGDLAQCGSGEHEDYQSCWNVWGQRTATPEQRTKCKDGDRHINDTRRCFTTKCDEGYISDNEWKCNLNSFKTDTKSIIATKSDSKKFESKSVNSF